MTAAIAGPAAADAFGWCGDEDAPRPATKDGRCARCGSSAMANLRPTVEPARPTITREEWLRQRRELITASDVAAILGEDPRRGRLAVYAEKIGALEPPDAEWMEWGRDVEGAIAKAYSRRAERPVYDMGAHEIQRHPDVPWLGATLDRRTEGSLANPSPVPGIAPLELKAVAGMKAKDWREDPPLYYVVQLQVQMACTGAAWGSLAALIGGIQVAWKDVLRDDRLINAMLPHLDEFRLRVLRRDPPEADGKAATFAALKALYADEDGKTVELDTEGEELADEWESAKAKAARAEAAAREAENRLRLRMGPASFGRLPDGSYLALRTTSRAGYTAKPTTYRQLKRHWPRLRRRG